jgi:hypothetical protein
VRAIVLTGDGKIFRRVRICRSAALLQEPGGCSRHNRLVRLVHCVMECPKPVIAPVNGAAISAGACSLNPTSRRRGSLSNETIRARGRRPPRQRFQPVGCAADDLYGQARAPTLPHELVPSVPRSVSLPSAGIGKTIAEKVPLQLLRPSVRSD